MLMLLSIYCIVHQLCHCPFNMLINHFLYRKPFLYHHKSVICYFLCFSKVDKLSQKEFLFSSTLASVGTVWPVCCSPVARSLMASASVVCLSVTALWETFYNYLILHFNVQNCPPFLCFLSHKLANNVPLLLYMIIYSTTLWPEMYCAVCS